MKSQFCRILALAAAALSLSACAAKTPPAHVEAPKMKTGELMLLESQNLAKFGERWKQGQKKTQDGEEVVRQGRAKIEEGQRMIEEGQRMMQESEEAYQGVKK
jgi:Spy/CpxP family protein refolding chaperone